MNSGLPSSTAKRLWRLPLVVLGIASLACGVWGGLSRMSIFLPMPADNANWITFHGALMVCGFLGTVIGLERAVGLPDKWAYAAPLLTGTGAAVVLAGRLGTPGPLLVLLGSMAFLVVTWRVVQLQKALFTVTMSVGAAAWVIGNVLWFCNWPFPRVVPFWVVFLGLTIAGERLDLSRFQRREEAARPLFYAATGVFLAGTILSAWLPLAGQRVSGAGLLMLALWLARFDIARRVIKQPGPPRFMAASLLSGYVWMAISGVLLAACAPLGPGTTYDAALHAFFIGFVFAMIFAHGPVIFPSVLSLPAIPIRPRFYLHLVLLHVSLTIRLAGDLGAWPSVRQWGGILNGIAILLFLVNTVASILVGARVAYQSKRPNRRHLHTPSDA